MTEALGEMASDRLGRLVGLGRVAVGQRRSVPARGELEA